MNIGDSMIFGIIILGLGLLLLVDTLYPGFSIDFNLVWPIVLMAISIYQMFKNKVFNVVMVIFFYIGLFFFVKNLHIFTVDISNLFFPILIILIGVLIIVDRGINRRKKMPLKFDKKGRIEYHALFTEIDEKVAVKNFKGAVISSVFGGVDIDFRDVEIKEKEVYIEVNAIFGGSNLILPEGYHVVMNSFAVFGGNENKYENQSDSKKTIYVNCNSFFGGTEIK